MCLYLGFANAEIKRLRAREAAAQLWVPQQRGPVAQVCWRIQHLGLTKSFLPSSRDEDKAVSLSLA